MTDDKPALRREGRWLVVRDNADENHIPVDHIAWVQDSGGTVIIHGRECETWFPPSGVTIDALRALIDEEPPGPGSPERWAESSVLLASQLVEMRDEIKALQSQIGFYQWREKKAEQEAAEGGSSEQDNAALRARVAELDGDTDNYSREQLQETLEAVAGERDRALNDVWSLEKENRKLREGRKGYREAIRNLQRAYENECRRNREIRETLRAV